jgi:hypothetical protein
MKALGTGKKGGLIPKRGLVPWSRRKALINKQREKQTVRF